jgi:endonuclease/exonuclease/phosphatase family metal-dependent hydrolase
LGSDEREANSFKVLTYNVKYDDSRDLKKAWSTRRDDVNAIIDFYNPDIFCVQEPMANQVDDMGQLAAYAFAAYGRDDGDRDGEHVGIYYRRSRYSLQGSGLFWLSETPDVPSFGWEARHRRMAVWAKLTDHLTGKPLTVVSVHLDHEFEGARDNGSGVLLERIPGIAQGGPVVLTGDFNEGPEGPGVKNVLTAYQDTRAIATHTPIGPNGTYNDFVVTNVAPPGRIDYIFIQGGLSALRHAHLVTITPDGRLPSDHFPVLAELVFD